MSQSFSISSAKTTLSLSPGEVFSGELLITNLSDSPLVPVVTPAPFSVQDEAYSPSFEDPNDHTQILSWVEVTDLPTEIPPGEQGIVSYTISVPETAPAGGQYFALLASSASSGTPALDSASALTIENVPKIADLFYVSIAGETKRSVSVLENSVKMFYLNSPISVSSLVKNSSNVHISVDYSLVVSSLLDGVDLYSTKESPNTRTLLPNTKFFNEAVWEDTPTLGVFKVSQEISYLGKTDLTESYVLVCPGWFLALLAAFVCSIFLALFERIRARRRRQKNRGEQSKQSIKKPEKSLDERNHKDYNNKYKKVIQK